MTKEEVEERRQKGESTSRKIKMLDVIFCSSISCFRNYEITIEMLFFWKQCWDQALRVKVVACLPFLLSLIKFTSQSNRASDQVREIIFQNKYSTIIVGWARARASTYVYSRTDSKSFSGICHTRCASVFTSFCIVNVSQQEKKKNPFLIRSHFFLSSSLRYCQARA